MSTINTKSLTMKPSVAVFLNEREIALAQRFIDNLNTPDFFEVNLSKLGNAGKEIAKIFVQEKHMTNTAWLFAKISEGEEKFGGLVVDGEGIDRAHQAIYLMYCNLIDNVPDGLSNAGACQSYVKL